MTIINRPCDTLITKIFTFDGAHQLPDHPGKCKNLHGHSWQLEVSIFGQIDSNTGMVMDFGDLKNIVNEKIINILDHSKLNDTLENPTAENILVWIWDQIDGELKSGGTNLLQELTLWESTDSKATITRKDILELKKREETGNYRKSVRPSII